MLSAFFKGCAYSRILLIQKQKVSDKQFFLNKTTYFYREKFIHFEIDEISFDENRGKKTRGGGA